MIIDTSLKLDDLRGGLERFWALSGEKVRSIADSSEAGGKAPVFTVQGRYTSRGWTEWTQGFQFGSALLQFDATGESWFLDYGRENTRKLMAPHVTHFGVHDHGFNNVSTYGNLLRLALEGKFEAGEWEREFYRMALCASGSVQAKRWTELPDGLGYIHSFNGPHSLFVDTIRSLRSLAVAHVLGHRMLDEGDVEIPLLGRLLAHARTTARFAVYYGEGRDAYDVPGRVAHESIFNLNDGAYRCPNSQQGFSPFSTWTRGLAWAVTGYPEQLEFLAGVPDEALEPFGGKADVIAEMERTALATAERYMVCSAADGIPYWDSAAPGLANLPGHLERPADPYNEHEPVDSSAAAIASQGLLRLGKYLEKKGDSERAARYWRAGLTVMSALLREPYLSTDPQHQGLVLHSLYHRPNGWDYVPEGAKVPCGESSMWGDYHARETALYLWRLVQDEPYLAFWNVR